MAEFLSCNLVCYTFCQPDIHALLLQEESALGYGNSCVQLVKASTDGVSKEQSEELEFRANAIAALGSLVCAQCGAGKYFLQTYYACYVCWFNTS